MMRLGDCYDIGHNGRSEGKQQGAILYMIHGLHMASLFEFCIAMDGLGAAKKYQEDY